MDERAFYDERQETKTQKLVCPMCKRDDHYPIRWIVRTKKKQPPRGMGREDQMKFEKARSYMTRLDEMVACRKCRKRIELTGQSVVLVGDNIPRPGDPDFDPETFGNR
jgi:uncharacterized protein YbaR (Trm112 family)